MLRKNLRLEARYDIRWVTWNSRNFIILGSISLFDFFPFFPEISFTFLFLIPTCHWLAHLSVCCNNNFAIFFMDVYEVVYFFSSFFYVLFYFRLDYYDTHCNLVSEIFCYKWIKENLTYSLETEYVERKNL